MSDLFESSSEGSHDDGLLEVVHEDCLGEEDNEIDDIKIKKKKRQGGPKSICSSSTKSGYSNDDGLFKQPFSRPRKPAHAKSTSLFSSHKANPSSQRS